MSNNSDNTIIDEDTVRFFVWSVRNFFITSTSIEPEVGAPYLFENFKHNDYTGIIGVSGSQKGAVYFTMGKQILADILAINYPEIKSGEVSEEELEEMRMDYAGEMANIVSGNVRNYLGEHFLISVPVVVTAPDTKMRMANGTQGIVFPVKWNGGDCNIVLNLEKNQQETAENVSELKQTI